MGYNYFPNYYSPSYYQPMPFVQQPVQQPVAQMPQQMQQQPVQAPQPEIRQNGFIRVKDESEVDAIRGMDINEVLDVMDELMGVLQTINPRLYNGVMRKLER